MVAALVAHARHVIDLIARIRSEAYTLQKVTSGQESAAKAAPDDESKVRAKRRPYYLT